MIEIINLSKEYSGNYALSDLSWEIRENGVYGFLGPNGAGKSTTMNIVTGCLSATSGDVRINGWSVLDNPIQAKQQIGYLPEIPPLYPDMSVREYLSFVARAKGVTNDYIKKEIEKVMDQCSLNDVADRLTKFLSKGYKQRVGIAQAVIGTPSVIILDEPTVGLDPEQIAEIRELIRSLGENHIVILSSHILSEVQSISKRLLIINKGRKIAEGSTEELQKTIDLNMNTMLFSVKCSDGAFDTVCKLLTNEGIQFCEKSRDAGRMDFSVETTNAEDTAEKMFYIFSDVRIPIIKIEYPKTNLEEIFLSFIHSDNPERAVKTNE